MKKILFLSSLVFWASSCSDVLDKTNLGSVPEDKVWGDVNYTTAYVNKLCRDNLPSWDNGISGNSDEAVGGGSILYGQLTSSSIDHWPYGSIRNINILLDNIENGGIEDGKKKEIKAQAYFLRAYRYFEMVRLYGGIPIIDKVQQLTDDLYVTRNKTSECIDFIVNDLDKAYEGLPYKWSGEDEGRITKAAALAMKARVLLYYASPQFNPENHKDRWEKAYQVNKQAKDELEANGYDLYPDYENFWFEEMNQEVVLVKRFQEPGLTHNWQAATRPLDESQNATGSNQPTLEMVESYPTINGKSIKEDPIYNSTIYWENRDPRFKASIIYNGAPWELSGKAGRKQWTFVGGELNSPTQTGFYCKKAIVESHTPYFAERGSTDWVEIRFAEVLMNYAECAAELGKTDEAYAVLKQIRDRAGILPGADGLYGLKAGMSQKEMLKAIMFERKIEFAFEGKRYWDLRRRRLFAEELNGTKRHGINPLIQVNKEEFLKDEGNIDLNKDYGTYFRDSIIEIDKVFSIDFKDNYYFYGIPMKHLETNSKLEQTQGWDDGSFNPYE